MNANPQIVTQLCPDSSRQPIPWATMVHDPEEIERGLEAGYRYKDWKKWDHGLAFIKSEIASAKIIGDHLIAHGIVNKQDKEIPVIWIPDGGILAKEGLKKAFDKAGIRASFSPCLGEINARYHISKTVIEAAKASGKIVIADGVINTGESITKLLDQLYDFNGQVILVANRVYHRVFEPSDFFKPLVDSMIDGTRNPNFPKPKDVALYTANVVGKLQDPVDIGDCVLEVHNQLVASAGERNAKQFKWLGELLPKRRQKAMPLSR